MREAQFFDGMTAETLPPPTLDRIILQRLPSVPAGIVDDRFPLGELVAEIPELNRGACALWARYDDKEDSRDAIRRANRQLGRRAVPDWFNDPSHLLEPIDQVMFVGGLLFPGVARWREGRAEGTSLVDCWWGTNGVRPGAAIIRDGILHLIGLDEHFQTWVFGDWSKWAARTWKGPIVHHTILDSSREKASNSLVVAHLMQKAAGGMAMCIVWSAAARAMQPWRVDMTHDNLMFRRLADPLIAARLPHQRLPLQPLFEGAAVGIWQWVESLRDPSGVVVKVPLTHFPDPPPPPSAKWVKSGSKSAASEGQIPLLQEALEGPLPGPSPAEEAFGIRPSAETPKERLTAMVKGAKQELVRAAMAQKPRQKAHWAAVLAEVEAALEGR